MNGRATAVAAIDAELVWQRLADLAKIGRRDDDAYGGLTRLALTHDDIAARRLVESWMREAGCEVDHDPVGNTFGTLRGTDATLAPVLMGSHIDSVVGAGRFDGCLGVVGAVEVLRSVGTLDRPRRSLVAVVFTDEEGARFGRDLLGSSAACGQMEIADALATGDARVVTVGAELAAHDLAGDAPRLCDSPPHAYLETHIEQGPCPRTSWNALGLRHRCGRHRMAHHRHRRAAGHAGATPMHMRRDAGLAAADLRLRLHRMTHDRQGLTVAVGLTSLEPGVVNVIPSRASLTVDMRSGHEAVLQEAERTARQLAELAATAHGCVVTRAELTSRTVPVAFDTTMVDRVGGCIEQHIGGRAERLWSGAGHDAQRVAAICPTGMVFVRSLNEGISHSPDEWSTPDDCAVGIRTMARAALGLAEE